MFICLISLKLEDLKNEETQQSYVIRLLGFYVYVAYIVKNVFVI